MPAPLLLLFEIVGTVAFAISGAMAAGAAAVVALRYLAVKYRWSLPKARCYM